MNLRVGLIVFGIVATMIVLALVLGGDGEASNSGAVSHNTYPEQIVFVEAYDLECPACAEVHPLLKQLREEYKDRIIFQVKHFPIQENHPRALIAHRFLEAAARQGKFWEFHDLLFENRNNWVTNNPNNITSDEQAIEQIKLLAGQVEGLDLDQLEEDRKSSLVNDIIQNDRQDLKRLGVTATPTFFLDGEKIQTKPGSLDEFRKLFDDALADFEARTGTGAGTNGEDATVQPDDQTETTPAN